MLEYEYVVSANFAVSRGISSELTTAVRKINVPYMPAIKTFSEFIRIQYNFSLVKFFPAGLNDDIKALRSFVSVFPEMRFCQTISIDQTNMKDYFSLKFGLHRVFLARPYKFNRTQYQWKIITDLARKAVKAIK